MGWSCRAEAGDTMRRWTEACVQQTGSQNTYRAGGKVYFWETSRTEHSDGAITGVVCVQTAPPRPEDGPYSAGYCKKVGTFRIEPDGTVSRAPLFLKVAARA